MSEIIERTAVPADRAGGWADRAHSLLAEVLYQHLGKVVVQAKLVSASQRFFCGRTNLWHTFTIPARTGVLTVKVIQEHAFGALFEGGEVVIRHETPRRLFGTRRTKVSPEEATKLI